MSNFLSIAHRNHLLSEGFNIEQIDQLIAWGVRSVTTPEEASDLRLPKHLAGIWFPFSGDFGQLRLDSPLSGPKYLSPKGISTKMWSPPGEKPMVIAEGYKDAAAGSLIGGIATGAIAGVFHWRCIPAGQGETIVFDADGWVNHRVFTASIGAAQRTKGKIVLIPHQIGEKAGLVEYLSRGHSYPELLATAMSDRLRKLSNCQEVSKNM